MIDVDLRLLIRRLNRFCARSLEAAAGLCVSRSHFEVTPEHLMTELLEEPGADMVTILKHLGLDSSRLARSTQRTLDSFKSGNTARPVFSSQLLGWMEQSWLLASIDLQLSEIRSGALLLTLAAHPERYAMGDELASLQDINADDLKRRFLELTVGSSEDETGGTGKGDGAAIRTESPQTALGRFAVNVTSRARAGEIDPVFCRDREIRQMIDILARRRKNNPILVGEAGVGKTAVVEGLALRIVCGDVPEVLRDVEILVLDLGLLQAGAGVRGEFENRLKAVISEVKSSTKPIVLFIDEAHTLIGAGNAAGMGDAANLLKPALARGELRTIAATTWSEYKKYFEKDAALARRFQLVTLEEPSEQDAVIILRGLREKYESAHGVKILDEAIVAAARMASRYISGRQLPDKAVDLLDTTAARVKVGLTSRPEALEQKDRVVQTLQRERESYQHDLLAGAAVDKNRLHEIEGRIEKEQEDLIQFEQRWESEREAINRVRTLRDQMASVADQDRSGAEAQLKSALDEMRTLQGRDGLLKLDVDSEAIARVVSDWTGIPVGKMLRDEAEAILTLEDRVAKRIKGQDEAIRTIAKGIRASKAGIGNPRAPMGVFLLVGSSGVGKTETALCLADLLFGGERFLVTVNMTEFQEKHSMARLIGSPPGYVGYGEGGVLTEAVRQRPYSVVLLDEVDQADPEVLNLFYQVFDKGMLADGEGRVIDFKNTVILMTTNLGAEAIVNCCANGDRPTADELTGQIRPPLSRRFKPALLARMTLVPFYPISSEVMNEIAGLKLRQVAERLWDSHRITMDYDQAVAEQIAQRCTEVDTGARNIDHIVQENLLPRISTEILERMSQGSLPERLKIRLEDGAFEITFQDQLVSAIT